jgi:hypothetical protein
MVFQWKMKMFPVEAQVAGEIFTGIEKKYGRVDPRVVVDESRMVNAPLYKCFEWDNNIAAEKYREKQAQTMIQNIVVVNVKDESGKSLEPVRAFVSVMDNENERKYVSIEVAVNNDDYNSQIIQRAFDELKAFEKRYEGINKFSDVFRAIRNLRI